MLLVLILSALFISVVTSEGVTWGILIAGANEWENYWSQADICQMYQVMHRAGVQDEHLIVWMYDDIAHSWHNLLHDGKIFNCDGCPDVYHGVVKDLTGSDITPPNFLKLLRGETMTIGSKKSLQSGPEDRIFLYFSDHGGAGVAFFPGFVPMHAKDFIDTLKFMHDNHKYSEMVIYMDTCHSGSMFNGLLPAEWNIYAATSADPEHVAWLCDCEGIVFHHCLNNCWGRFFMVDTMNSVKAKTFGTRTIEEQFVFVQNQTIRVKMQQSCQYGNINIAKNSSLAAFQGTGEAIGVGGDGASFPRMGSEQRVQKTHGKHQYLISQYAADPSEERLLALARYEDHIARVDATWNAFADALHLPPIGGQLADCYPKEPVKPVCMKKMVSMAMAECGQFDEYSSQYTLHLKHACDEGILVKEAQLVLHGLC